MWVFGLTSGLTRPGLELSAQGRGLRVQALLDVYRDVLRAKARPCVGERSSLETGKLV